MKKLLYWIDRWLHPEAQGYVCTRCLRTKWGIAKWGCGRADPLWFSPPEAPCRAAPLEFQSPFRRWLRDRWGILLP